MGLSISVGVCAYNEEKTIGRVLDAILSQQSARGEIREVLVISSGSTDNTNEIVSDYGRKDKRVRLISQTEKEGKASAVNLFLKTANADVLILLSADVLPQKNAFSALIEPFANESVGMVTGRPVPDNNPETFMGFVVHLIWRLHNQLQMASPKANEILAMRPVVKKIDKKTAVDDLQLEALVKEKGYMVVYRPDAVVTNHGPETLKDLIKQRRRIITGYLHSRDTLDYVPVTMDKIRVFSVLLNNLDFNVKKLIWTIAAVAIEVYIRASANLDYYVFEENPYNWEMAESTKKLGK